MTVERANLGLRRIKPRSSRKHRNARTDRVSNDRPGKASSALIEYAYNVTRIDPARGCIPRVNTDWLATGDLAFPTTGAVIKLTMKAASWLVRD